MTLLFLSVELQSAFSNIHIGSCNFKSFIKFNKTYIQIPHHPSELSKFSSNVFPIYLCFCDASNSTLFLFEIYLEFSICIFVYTFLLIKHFLSNNWNEWMEDCSRKINCLPSIFRLFPKLFLEIWVFWIKIRIWNSKLFFWKSVILLNLLRMYVSKFMLFGYLYYSISVLLLKIFVIN